MPTLHRPRLTESATPMLEVWDRMHDGLVPNARAILNMIDYHDRYDVEPSQQGSDLSESEKEGLKPIVRSLMDAAIESEVVRGGVLASTLNKIAKNPSLFTNQLSGAVQWEMACEYRRGEEKPGTYCMDIWGNNQTLGTYSLEIPSAANIARAAEAACCRIKVARSAGRPLNPANRILAERLSEVFLSSGQSIARRRQSVKMFDKKVVYAERGVFRDFLELVVPPLQKLLRENALAPVTIDSVVRLAIKGLYSPQLPNFSHHANSK